MKCKSISVLAYFTLVWLGYYYWWTNRPLSSRCRWLRESYFKYFIFLKGNHCFQAEIQAFLHHCEDFLFFSVSYHCHLFIWQPVRQNSTEVCKYFPLGSGKCSVHFSQTFNQPNQQPIWLIQEMTLRLIDKREKMLASALISNHPIFCI